MRHTDMLQAGIVGTNSSYVRTINGVAQIRPLQHCHRQIASAAAAKAIAGSDHIAELAAAVSRRAAVHSRIVELTRTVAMWSVSLGAATCFDKTAAVAREITLLGRLSKQLVAGSALTTAASVRWIGTPLTLAPLTRIGRSTEALVAASSRSFTDLWQRLEYCYPPNLRGLASLDQAARIARAEGIAVCGVPRAEIVQELLAAPDATTRRQVLLYRREAIVEDCRDVLVGLDGELADQCRFAVGAFADGHSFAAQSHAAGVITSVLEVIPKRFRREFPSKPLDKVPINRLRWWLALQPVDAAFVSWKPESGKPPPDQFSRNPTSHCVGQTGVFSEYRSLSAVMLAASLTRHFGQHIVDQFSQP